MKTLCVFGLIHAFALLAAAQPTISPARDDVTVVIDGAQVHQRIDGFGSCLFGGFELFERGNFDSVAPLGVTYKTDPSQRAAILKAAIYGLGLSHARLTIPPLGIEPENDNDDPQVMAWDRLNWSGQSGKPTSSRAIENRANGLVEWGEFLRTAVPLGLANWIPTPGGLPAWLKHKMNDPTDPKRFEEYAEWAAAHLLYLKRTYGLEAPYWSLHNEPDVEGWTSPEFYTQWVKATGSRFEKEGLTTKIMFPDFMDVNRAVPLTRAVLADERARKYIGALAYHHYRSSGDGPQVFLELAAHPERAAGDKHFEQVTRAPREMAELGSRYGIPSWQTETAY
ncbi:MAG: hypothetical protein ACM359_04140, partial [Bacillota bacterium]